MDHLWTPWRYAYVTSADTRRGPAFRRAGGVAGRPGVRLLQSDCLIDFAIANGMSADEAEAAGGLILRGKHCFVCLNAFPYTSGHVMVMPMRTSTGWRDAGRGGARTDGPGAADGAGA